MVVLNVIRFDHQASNYYLGKIHCRKLIFAIAGWILYQVFHDARFTFFMDMMVPMRVVYAFYVVLGILAVLGIFLAFWRKNEYFLIPAILFLILSIITGLKEIGVAIWALVLPNYRIHEAFGEQHRYAPYNHTFYYHGYRAPKKYVAFYSILTLCFAPLVLIVDIILLIIAIKVYKYYHDWKVARVKGGDVVGYASRVGDSLQAQTINVNN